MNEFFGGKNDLLPPLVHKFEGEGFGLFLDILDTGLIEAKNEEDEEVIAQVGD